jgi:hypothetical protein
MIWAAEMRLCPGYYDEYLNHNGSRLALLSTKKKKESLCNSPNEYPEL